VIVACAVPPNVEPGRGAFLCLVDIAAAMGLEEECAAAASRPSSTDVEEDLRQLKGELHLVAEGRVGLPGPSRTTHMPKVKPLSRTLRWPSKGPAAAERYRARGEN